MKADAAGDADEAGALSLFDGGGELGERMRATGRRPRTGPQGRRVLIVDDNADAADTLADLLTDLGHRTRADRGSSLRLIAVRGYGQDADRSGRSGGRDLGESGRS